MRTAYPSVVEMERIRGHYALETPDYPPNPVYYLYSADQLSKRQRQENVCVSQWKETDKAEIARAVEAGRLDGESMNADMFVPCEVYQAVEWHILRVNGELAGYLRAECGYANIYDIGWLYVEPRFRGKGYAVDLVLAFSRDMFSRGNIPHYGYAISPASARVAEKCGFICDQPLPICHRLIQGSMTPKA